MQVLPVIVPFIRTTSNLALTCKGVCVWLFNNGFPITSSKAEICPENLSFFKLLDYPNLDEWTINEFFAAIKTDGRNRLLLLLESGANIEAKDSYRETALISAAVYGKVESLKILLEHKANIDAKDENGKTALVWAARYGETDCLKILLDHKANIEAKNYYGWTALHFAAANGRTECLKLLLQHKANIEAKNNYGDTALILAARFGITECVRLLLQHGANVVPGLREKYPQYSELWLDSTL